MSEKFLSGTKTLNKQTETKRKKEFGAKLSFLKRKKCSRNVVGY